MLNNETLAVFLFIFAVGFVFVAEMYLIVKAIFLKQIRELVNAFSIIVHVLFGIGMLCILYGFFIEPYFIEVSHQVIYTDKLDSTSLRVVQLSDIHSEKNIRNEKKLPILINEL